MKITFYREGHANNSSSSHSLIFTENYNQINSDETCEFGWSYFTCGSVEGKKNYILACLRTSFERNIKLQYNYCDDIEYEDMDVFRDMIFVKWVNKHFNEFDFDVKNQKDTYVDHQSVFYFPTYRDISKGINKEFAKDLIKEILKPQYIFLGGNDNDDRGGHSLYDEGDLNEITKIWKRFTDLYVLSMVEYDAKTGEYVFGAPGGIGSLLKIKF